MRTPIIDGQSIDRFIPANLRDMFYNHPLPRYKYATHNGYAPYNFSTNGLVLYLPLWALKDSSFKSVDRYHYLSTVTGALWQPDGRLFDGDDKIAISPAITLANATPWTIEFIVYLTTQEANNVILGHSSVNGNISWRPNNRLYFQTNGQVTSVYGTFSSSMLSRWVHGAITCNGAGSVKFYEDAALVVTRAYAETAFTINSVANYSTAFGNGTHGEFRVYTRQLSQPELSHNRLTTIWRYPL